MEQDYSPDVSGDVALSSADVAVVDVETTGGSHADRVIEIGIVRFGRLLVDEPRIVVDQLVNPGIPIQPMATRVHGITDRDVRNAPTWSEVEPAVRRALTGVRPCAYGAAFDRRMIAGMGLSVPPVEVWLDPLRLCKRLDEKGPHTLTAACERRGIRIGGHRAASDALATARLLVSMLRELPRLPSTVGDLVEWLAGPASKARKVPPVRRMWRVQGGVGGTMFLGGPHGGRRFDGGPWWVISSGKAIAFWSEADAIVAARWSCGRAVEVDRAGGGAA